MSSTSRNPTVSVIMPVRNGARTVRAAIGSVLNQSFTNFEIVVVDDGSNDETPQILRQMAHDPRLRPVRQEPGGITSALNHGLRQARGRYIARLDADDTAYPHRLAAQVRAMDRDPSLVVLGSAVDVVNEAGSRIGRIAYPRSNRALRRQLRFRNPFVHSSIVMRSDAVCQVGGYRRAFELAEDYDLWLRLAQVGRIGNLKASLGAYCISAGSLSRTAATPQEFAFAIARRFHQTAHRTDAPPWLQAEPLARTFDSAGGLFEHESRFFRLLDQVRRQPAEVTPAAAQALVRAARKISRTERRLALEAIQTARDANSALLPGLVAAQLDPLHLIRLWFRDRRQSRRECRSAT